MTDQEYLQKLLELLEHLIGLNKLVSLDPLKKSNLNNFYLGNKDGIQINSTLKTFIQSAKLLNSHILRVENDEYNKKAISYIEAFLENHWEAKNFVGPFSKENTAFLNLLKNPSQYP